MKKMEDDTITSRKRKLENQQEEEGEVEDNGSYFLVYHRLIFSLLGGDLLFFKLIPEN